MNTIRLQDSTKINVYDSNPQLLDQPDFSNIPKTTLEYRNDVSTSLSLDKAQDLARPITLSTLQQELMIWHHRICNLTYHIVFSLASSGFIPRQLIECQNKPPLCVECQFGQDHRRPWKTKGKKSRSIHILSQKDLETVYW